MFLTIKLYLHFNCVLMLNWIVWNRTIFDNETVLTLNWLVWNRTNYFNKNGFGLKYPTNVDMLSTKPNKCWYANNKTKCWYANNKTKQNQTKNIYFQDKVSAGKCTWEILKQSQTGLNSEVSFSKTGCQTMAKPIYQPLHSADFNSFEFRVFLLLDQLPHQGWRT